MVEIAGDAGCLLRNAGVARGAEELGDPGRLLQFPNQGVFAAAAAQHQNFHGFSNQKGYEVATG